MVYDAKMYLTICLYRPLMVAELWHNRLFKIKPHTLSYYIWQRNPLFSRTDLNQRGLPGHFSKPVLNIIIKGLVAPVAAVNHPPYGHDGVIVIPWHI